MRNENKRLAAVVLGILTISKVRLNLVLKRIIVLISSKFVYSAPVKRLENQVKRISNWSEILRKIN